MILGVANYPVVAVRAEPEQGTVRRIGVAAGPRSIEPVEVRSADSNPPVRQVVRRRPRCLTISAIPPTITDWKPVS